MTLRFKKTRLIFSFPLVAVLAILLGQQVAALDLAKAEIQGISISTGDFAAKNPASDAVVTATSSDSSLSSNSSATPTPQETVNQMAIEMESGDTAGVYNLMSTEFQDTFTLDNFKAAWVDSGEQILSVENLPTTQTLPEGWYEQQIIAKTQSGKADKFNIVLHLENGVWVIYVTELIS